MQNWPPELDALVAAPNHHRVLFENESVRTIETRVHAGDVVPVHTHQWSGASYIVSWSDVVRRNAAGEVTFESRSSGVHPEPGTAGWQHPLEPHSLENVGDDTLIVITVELKRER